MPPPKSPESPNGMSDALVYLTNTEELGAFRQGMEDSGKDLTSWSKIESMANQNVARDAEVTDETFSKAYVLGAMGLEFVQNVEDLAYDMKVEGATAEEVRASIVENLMGNLDPDSTAHINISKIINSESLKSLADYVTNVKRTSKGEEAASAKEAHEGEGIMAEEKKKIRDFLIATASSEGSATVENWSDSFLAQIERIATSNYARALAHGVVMGAARDPNQKDHTFEMMVNRGVLSSFTENDIGMFRQLAGNVSRAPVERFTSASKHVAYKIDNSELSDDSRVVATALFDGILAGSAGEHGVQFFDRKIK